MGEIMIHEKYCILDIETWTPEGSPNPEVDELRYVGFKSRDKHCILHYPTDETKIHDIMNFFDYYVGHKIKDYDIPILNRYGFYTKEYSTIIDTLQIARNRCKSMMYLDLNKGDHSLKKLAERFRLEAQKGDFDYKLLEQEKLSSVEYELLEKYLIGDLDTTDELFKYFYEFFYGFREFVSEKHQKNLHWLTASAGATAYKCICNQAGIPEEYEDVEGAQKAYQGGFVSEPYIDFVKG